SSNCCLATTKLAWSGWHLLYIGEIRGGPDADGSAIAQAREGVFEVPGAIYKPNYSGVRTGPLSRKRGLLQIQIAVPESIVHGTLEDALRFCFDALRTGIQLAAGRLVKARMPFDRAAMEGWVSRMERRLVH